jgi:hypothetical protein
MEGKPVRRHALTKARKAVGSSGSNVTARPPRSPWVWPVLAAGLLAFGAVAYGPTLRLPFMGDDYVFLDHTLYSRFADLWSTRNVDFGWYRPWSREFHFWSIERIAGASEQAFRIASLVLWLAGLLLYTATLVKVAGTRTAFLACVGVATLAFWGTSLLWVSGSQDLWMLVFAMGSLLLFVSRHRGWAATVFVGALLSKETAATLPLILLGYCLLVERRDLKSSIARTAVFWIILSSWVFLHPTLLSRLIHPESLRLTVYRLPPYEALLRTGLAAVSLDAVPRPKGMTLGYAFRVVVSAVTIGMLLMWLLRKTRSAGAGTVGQPLRALWGWGIWWAVAAWIPLAFPTTGWRSYYGCLGALGAWLAISVWLADRPRTAVAIVVGLALIRGAQSKTASWEWGEWYWLRAGSFLEAIRADLLVTHPVLPPHARVYFGRIPNNIGLIVAQQSALRVWYRDTTLSAQYYSAYRPRGAGEPPGKDFFFRFDSTGVRSLVEVVSGPEDIDAAREHNPEWESDHEKLAMLFLRAGDARRAAVEFEKLSELPTRSDAAVFASVCRNIVGDYAQADSLLSAAQRRTNLSRTEIANRVQSLEATIPRAKIP